MRAPAAAGLNSQVQDTGNTAGAEPAAAAVAARALEAAQRANAHPGLAALLREAGWADLAAWLSNDGRGAHLVPAVRRLVSFDKGLRKKGQRPIANPLGYLRECIGNGWAQEKAAARAEGKFHADKAARAHNRPSTTRREEARAKREADDQAAAAIRAAEAAASRERIGRLQRATSPPTMTPAEVEARKAQLRATVGEPQ